MTWSNIRRFCPHVILENGLIRTLDPQVPTQRALAIAGERIAGGVGVHETALASPEVVDLGGRVVAPRLHRRARPLPDVGARAERDPPRRLRLARRGARAPARAHRGRRAALAARLRLAQRRLAAAARADAAGPRRDHRRHAGRADREGLPLALAQLRGARARRTATSRSKAASSSATRAASRPACCARRRRGGSRSATWSSPDDEYLEAMRAGVKLANARGVTAVHDKDGWLGALRLWQQLEERGHADAARLAVDPARPARRRVAVGLRSGFGEPDCCGSAT